jgi:hypothetical protein
MTSFLHATAQVRIDRDVEERSNTSPSRSGGTGLSTESSEKEWDGRLANGFLGLHDALELCALYLELCALFSVSLFVWCSVLL